MCRKLSDIKFESNHKGIETGRFFLIPSPKKCFGREYEILYKVFGFEGDTIYAQRINRRTGKMPGNAPILETFDFNTIFPKN